MQKQFTHSKARMQVQSHQASSHISFIVSFVIQVTDHLKAKSRTSLYHRGKGLNAIVNLKNKMSTALYFTGKHTKPDGILNITKGANESYSKRYSYGIDGWNS
jgi:hypothetical protein